MKILRIPAILLLLALVITAACALVLPRDEALAGTLHIPAAGVKTEIYTDDNRPCDCCGLLWHGGTTTVHDDLSTVQIGDVATLTTLDGTRMVMECVDVSPCLRIGPLTITRYGFVKPDGTVMVVCRCMGYRFVIQ